MLDFLQSKAAAWMAFLLVLAVYLVGMITSIADPDLWGYLAFGYTFWTQPGFPYTDPFSYMPTNPVWIYHEWLTGVLFFPLYASFGAVALQILRYGLIMGALGFVYATARLRGASKALALLGLFFPVFAISTGYAPVRAQVLTYFFFALTLFLLESCRKEQRFKRLWWLPLITLVWCNLHGGFVSGLAIMALYGIGEIFSPRRFKPYLLIVIPCLLATLVNPYGWDYWPYLIKAILMPRPEIAEWISMWRAYSIGYTHLSLPLFIGLFPLALVFCLGPLKKDRAAILVLAATAWMAFSHIRHIPFMGLAIAALLPSGGGFFVKTKTRESMLLSIAVLLCLSFLFVLNGKVFMARIKNPQVFRAPFSLEILPDSQVLEDQMSYPIGGIAFLKKNGIKGNVLTEFDWGQFVLWSLRGCKIAMDGRYETVYPDYVCKEYFAFAYGRPGARRYLEKYPHQIALLKLKSITTAQLARSDDWVPVYKGDGCAVFLRKSAFQITTKTEDP